MRMRLRNFGHHTRLYLSEKTEPALTLYRLSAMYALHHSVRYLSSIRLSYFLQQRVDRFLHQLKRRSPRSKNLWVNKLTFACRFSANNYRSSWKLIHVAGAQSATRGTRGYTEEPAKMIPFRSGR